MSGNLKPVREISGNLLTVRELSGNKPCHGKGTKNWLLLVAYILVFSSIQLIQLILHNEVILKFTF